MIRGYFTPGIQTLNNCNSIELGVTPSPDSREFYFCENRGCPSECHGCYEAGAHDCHPLTTFGTQSQCQGAGNQWCGAPVCNYNPISKTHQFLQLSSHTCVSVCPSGMFHILDDGQRVCGQQCSPGKTCVDESCVAARCKEGSGCCELGGIGTCSEVVPADFVSKSSIIQTDADGCGSNLDINGYPQSGLTRRTICCKSQSVLVPKEPSGATCGDIDGDASSATSSFFCGAAFHLKVNPNNINCGETPCALNNNAAQKAACCAGDSHSPSPSKNAPDATTDSGTTESTASLLVTRSKVTQCQIMNEGDPSGCDITIQLQDSQAGLLPSSSNYIINCTSSKLIMVPSTSLNNIDALGTIASSPPLSLRVLASRNYNEEEREDSSTAMNIRGQTLTCSLFSAHFSAQERKNNEMKLVNSISITFSVRNVLLPRIGSVRKAAHNATLPPDTLPPDEEYGRNLVRRGGKGRKGRTEDKVLLEIITSGQAFIKINVPSSRGNSGGFHNPNTYLVSLGEANPTMILLPTRLWTKDAIVVSLPSFDIGCPNGRRDVCYWGMRVDNTEDDLGNGGGTISCPSNAKFSNRPDLWMNPFSPDICDLQLYGITATPLPPTSESVLPSSLPSSSYVIKYVSQCESFLEPGSSECVTLDTASLCAFGFGDECRSCPFGGSCPGGFEIRSFPGFYTLSFDKGIVVACRPPSIERCIGYDLERTNETICGIEYDGYKCDKCAKNYYENPGGDCQKCRDNTGIMADELWNAAYPFLSLLLLLSLSMLSIVYYLEATAHNDVHEMEARHRKSIDTESIESGEAAENKHPQNAKAAMFDRRASVCNRTVRHVREFSIWFILSAQVMASASSSPAPGLPVWILRMYASVAFFNLDSSYVVHPDCAPDPTVFPSFILSGVLFLTLLQTFLFLVQPIFKHFDESQYVHTTHLTFATFQGTLFIFMSFVYPIVAKVTLASMKCDDNGNGVYTFGAQNDPCWEGRHLRLGVLAVCSFIFYLISFPACTFVYLRCVIVKEFKEIRTKSRLARWEHFIDDDYQPGYFWFRHLYWLVSFILFAIYLHVPIGWLRCILIVILFIGYLSLLHAFSPFARTERYKLYVRTSLVLTSMLVAVLDAAQFHKDQTSKTGVRLLDLPDLGAAASPSSSSSSSSSFPLDDEEGEIVIAMLTYALATSCVVALVVLPGSFFLSNYGSRLRCKKKKEEDSASNSNNAVAIELSEINAKIKNPMIKKNDELIEGQNGWERHFDTDQQTFYWYNTTTGESRWEEV